MSKKNQNINDLKTQYIGKVFNLLTVIDVIKSETSITGKSKILFTCRCKCGNIKNINYYYVIHSITKSCGCYSHSDNTNKINKLKEDYIGKTINQLTIIDVIKQRGKNNRSEIMFVCKCTCGNIKNIRIAHVLNNKVYSCGCYNCSLYKSRKAIDWYKNNIDVLKGKSVKQIEWLKTQQINIINNCKLYDFKSLIEITHPDYIDSLINGLIGTNDIIETKCPVCNKYSKHKLGNIFILHTGKFKNNSIPLCLQCTCKSYSSQYEDEIANYISSFTSCECTRNSRDIINPLELDIYYPEKKIAIEFNGDYWHSNKFKDKDYHYNKFKLCKENNILLISIFESEWNIRKDEIKQYIKDTFNNTENKLSFNEDKTLMNNNYPNIKYLNTDLKVKYTSYNFNKYIVYTCGLSYINN